MEFKRLHVQLCLAPPPEHDVDFKEGLDSATAILNKAVETITVFAALNVVYEMPEGTERNKSAAQLIENKQAVLPSSLLDLLRDIYCNPVVDKKVSIVVLDKKLVKIST